MHEKLVGIITNINNNPLTIETKKVGLCRISAGAVLDLFDNLENRPEDLTVEAREVDLEHGLSHTFLKLEFAGETYYWDGVGTTKSEPYLGTEQEAPPHLL